MRERRHMSGWSPKHVWMMPITCLKDTQNMCGWCRNHVCNMTKSCRTDEPNHALASCRPTPRGGVPRGLGPLDSRARGVRLGPFGRFLVIFQTFEQIKIFEKCFYKFKRHIQNVSNKSSRTCPGDAQYMSGWSPKHVWMMPKTCLKDTHNMYVWCPNHVWNMTRSCLKHAWMHTWMHGCMRFVWHVLNMSFKFVKTFFKDLYLFKSLENH